MKKFLGIIVLFIIAIVLVLIFAKDDNYIKTSNLYISEIVASNSYTHKDKDGEYSDYIEIYNDYDYDINLLNYHLTDSMYESDKWTFPEITIAAHEYMLVYASGKNKCHEKDNCHLNFKLKKEGETISLIDDTGNIINRVNFNNLNSDESISFIKNKYVITIPTPGMENKLEKIDKDKSKYTININEYLSHNKGFNYANDGASYDFIEIYNYGDNDVNLKGLSLSDNEDNLNKYIFPEIIIKKKEFLVIYLTGGKEIENNIYANFKLSDTDKEIFLSIKGSIIDKIPVVKLKDNMSYGKVDDKWYYFYIPTPGKENNTKKIERIDDNGNSQNISS